MAIQKSKTLKNGVVGNYWRIYDVSVDLLIGIEPFPVTFSLGLWLDSAASAAGKTPILKGKQYTFTFTRTEIISGNILALGYGKIKTKAETMITSPFGLGAEPVPFDSDISGGTTVL